MTPDYKKLYLELIKAVKPLTMAGGFKEQDWLTLSRIYDRQVKIIVKRDWYEADRGDLYE